MQKTTHPLYRWYVLAVLTLVYVFNFIDRQILVVLQEPIKAELSLSDTQLGLLTGFMFAIFYATLGIPIARLADKGNRRTVIAWSIGIWSLMTALSGMVTSYLQLALARIGVGIGEAGGSPPAHSMISDYFPPQLRALAMAIFSSGIFIGVMLGFLVGGYLNDHYGWRMAFFVAGVPGLLIALLVRFTVNEPIRGRYDPTPDTDTLPNTWQALQLFWRLKTFRYLALAGSLMAFTSYGINNWLPSFIIRQYQISIGDAGVLFALLLGGGGFIGTLLGGLITKRLVARDIRWYLWLPALLTVSATPFAIACFLGDQLTTSLALYIWPAISGAVYLGPTLALCHALVQPRLRALISAILLFIMSLVGLGLGPVFTGLMSDFFADSYGAIDGLRYALVVTTLIGSLSVVLLLIASKTIRAETQTAAVNAPQELALDTA